MWVCHVFTCMSILGVGMHIYVLYTYIWGMACTCVCMGCACMYIYLCCVCMYVHVSEVSMHCVFYAYIYMCIHMYVYVYIYVSGNGHAHVYMLCAYSCTWLGGHALCVCVCVCAWECMQEKTWSVTLSQWSHLPLTPRNSYFTLMFSLLELRWLWVSHWNTNKKLEVHNTCKVIWTNSKWNVCSLNLAVLELNWYTNKRSIWIFPGMEIKCSVLRYQCDLLY